MNGKTDIIQHHYDRAGKGYYPEGMMAVGFTEIEAFEISPQCPAICNIYNSS